ncbi:MAG TPA: DNA-3-methyladenine glycosylase 2 family protein [Candidatus Sulfotelmatobacter sp.]|nr:DNA-3-methyladenine glycosylase 2 family protein [Candidatus Sulfotelmatobacter sp.]
MDAVVDGAAAAAELKRALRSIARADADMARAIKLAGPLPDRARPPGFITLLRSICFQQLSLASAGAIWARLEAAVDPLTPAALLALEEAAMRGFGFSGPKVRYARHLAEAIHLGQLDLDGLHALEDELALAELCKIKGIGRWTAEVYLLFALGRADIFPADDLALQVAMQRVKRLRKRPDRKRMLKLAEPWRPYRGVGARVLWHYYRTVKAGSAGGVG